MGTNDGERAVAPRHETPNRTDFKRQRFSQNFHFLPSFPALRFPLDYQRFEVEISKKNLSLPSKTLSTWRVHEDGRSRGGKVHVTSSTCTTSRRRIRSSTPFSYALFFISERRGERVHITRRVRISKSGLFDIYFRAVRTMPVVNDTLKSCAPIAGR